MLSAILRLDDLSQGTELRARVLIRAVVLIVEACFSGRSYRHGYLRGVVTLDSRLHPTTLSTVSYAVASVIEDLVYFALG